jgi:hypothetical protein
MVRPERRVLLALLRVRGLEKGRLYILTTPENESDLYQLPTEVLGQIRRDLV